VVPATVTNFDLRGEWYFGNGDTLTASLFYKDIENPIEFFESAAFEDALAAEIINASSGEITGLELEWLKSLEFLGDSFVPFFVAGNLTVLDTELVATGSDADAPTNAVRNMTGASELAFNMQLGYDSNDGKHAAMLVYNVFDERLYLAGRNGSADSFEQPFHSLDMTYSFYPDESSTIKLKVKNLLDESIEIEQNGVTTFTKAPGLSVSLDYKWAF
jgi:outer membrane receptor protein involved in Fe transport